MVIITQENDKIQIRNLMNNSEIYLEYNNLTDAMTSLMNLTEKLKRFTKGAPGYEKRKWAGFYTTFADEVADDAKAIIEKHHQAMEAEMKSKGCYI